MIVVADSSPLIALAAIGRHELLHQLYGEIHIPLAVWQEVNGRPTEPFKRELLTAAWLIQRSPMNGDLISSLGQTLGPGEAEAIALAVELQAPLLIIDERLGRRAAARFGILPIGVLGVLIEAKNRGHIALVGPILDQLHKQAGFRLSQTLISRVLSDCGE